MNLYEVLGVSSNCSADVLRQEYRRRLLECHPDKTGSDDQANKQRFDQIQHAYKILSNADLRFKYDQEQQRKHLHTLPHVNIDLDVDDNVNDDGYICRCGTILEIDNSADTDLIECPNCSMKIQLKSQ